MFSNVYVKSFLIRQLENYKSLHEYYTEIYFHTLKEITDF